MHVHHPGELLEHVRVDLLLWLVVGAAIVVATTVVAVAVVVAVTVVVATTVAVILAAVVAIVAVVLAAVVAVVVVIVAGVVALVIVRRSATVASTLLIVLLPVCFHPLSEEWVIVLRGTFVVLVELMARGEWWVATWGWLGTVFGFVVGVVTTHYCHCFVCRLVFWCQPTLHGC